MQEMITLDVFDRNGEFLGVKNFYSDDKNKAKINQWLRQFHDTTSTIAIMHNNKTDFQHNMQVRITIKDIKDHTTPISAKNLIPNAIYFAVRHAIKATWLNDRDQFYYPNDKWQEDSEFQNDCLAFSLFHPQNRIQSSEGVNHFIPFSESEVGAKEAFESHFMQEFIKGKIKADSKTCHTERSEVSQANNKDISGKALNMTKKSHKKPIQPSLSDEIFSYQKQDFIPDKPLEFSPEAQAVFNAGLALFQHYHAQDFSNNGIFHAKSYEHLNAYNPNASLYDIKAYFQGFSEKGKMNPPQKSQDEFYKNLIATLNESLQILGKKIEPKIYEYGFLRK